MSDVAVRLLLRITLFGQNQQAGIRLFVLYGIRLAGSAYSIACSYVGILGTHGKAISVLFRDCHTEWDLK